MNNNSSTPTLYRLASCTDEPPKEDGRYFVLDDSGCQDMLSFQDGKWFAIGFDEEGDMEVNVTGFYLTPYTPAEEKGVQWYLPTDAPEVGEYVLVCIGENTVLKGRLMLNGWTAFFADGEKLVGPVREVTKWMPLPTTDTSPTPEAGEIEKLIEKNEILKSWKAQATAVMPDFQAIGEALGIGLGQNIHDKILPGINGLKEENERLKGLIKEIYVEGVETGISEPGMGSAKWKQLKEKYNL